ncbi:MAG: HAMP domain-containing sensor histidine kinase [Bacteroides sp.]|jgi:two-component system phosphate regulon sensor histidine kinase PhoR|nr:HAMP domain-containing sensor histidine kinase [Bacteroides sp.]
MQKKNPHGVVMLMVVSILLLILLQGLWLRAEYKAASDSFRRETNLVFRSTLSHLADSLFFSQVRLLPEYDSLESQGGPISVSMFAESHDSLPPGSPRFREREIRRREQDSIRNKRRNLGLGGSQQSPDSMHIVVMRPNGPSPGNMRNIYLAYAEGIESDTLKELYQKALPDRYQNLPMEIVIREVDWRQHSWNRPPPLRNDSIPFITGFIPLGMNKMYAASFDGVRAYLFSSILPQLGFSVFITGLILLSFIIVFRSLRSQQRLLEQKNDFIGNMTHELKTPVATVGVALEAMKSFDVLKDPEKTQEYIDMARHELDRLGMMTDKILKTSVFDYETEIRNNKTAVDLLPIVEKVMASFQLVAERKKTHFHFEHKGQSLVMGHQEHLTQMIYNLVDNAFKYAGDSPEIKVSLEEQADSAELRVSDQGHGISLEHQSRIFEKFYRIPSGDVHTVKGYGLGLNYVAGVVKSHGGKISIESKPGDGAIFVVKLPKIG